MNLFSGVSDSKSTEKLMPFIILLFYIYLARLFILVDKGSVPFFLDYLSFKYHANGLATLTADIISYSALVAALLLFYISKNAFIRYGSYVLTFLTLSLHLGYKSINMYGYGFTEASNLLAEYRFAGDALTTFLPQYLWQLFYSFSVTVLIVLLCLLIRRRVSVFLPAAIIVLPLLYIIFGGNFLLIEQKVFPVVYKVPVITLDAYSQKLYVGPRKAPFIEPAKKKTPSKIFLIVDESIRGDMLGINGSSANTTPFLRTAEKRIFNYGISSSATNCSGETNLVLRSGIRLDQLPDTEYASLKNPDILQYAKAAGYTTYYIDGQNRRSKHHNFMSNHDFSNIDRYYQIKKMYRGIEMYEIDYKIVDMIGEIMKKDEPSFVYVLKAGAHFSYELNYPPGNRVFIPTMDEADMWWSRGTQHILNSYSNAILWTVDGFFKKFLTLTKDHDAWTLYTSDHGQSFSKKYTHCATIDPPSEQANVPIIIISPTTDSDLKDELDAYYASNKNRLTHYELFPSILYLMGYEKEKINKIYGRTVFEKISRHPEQRKFVSGNMFGNGIFEKNTFHSASGTN
jgi:glucan phosphoethanolaminetransferase (alkaline phosphatase superfamily)